MADIDNILDLFDCNNNNDGVPVNHVLNRYCVGLLHDNYFFLNTI